MLISLRTRAEEFSIREEDGDGGAEGGDEGVVLVLRWDVMGWDLGGLGGSGMGWEGWDGMGWAVRDGGEGVRRKNS